MDFANPLYLEDNNSHQITMSRSLEIGEAKNNFKEKTPINSNFLASIGTHELYSLEMWRATATELVATACLVFTLTISIISSLESNETDPKLLIPFTVFIIAFFFLLTTIPLSGGHMSPVFTFIAALKGLITPIRALCYVSAQCIGSIFSYMIINGSMDPDIVQKYSLGGCIINGNGNGIPMETALMLEFCCCFIVLYVGVTVAFHKRRMKELGLVMICVILASSMGLAIFVSISVTGKAGYGGVGLNPARCLGAALVHGGPLWHGHWVYWLGPFLACLLCIMFLLSLYLRKTCFDHSLIVQNFTMRRGLVLTSIEICHVRLIVDVASSQWMDQY